jgi:hypothetical protein
VKHREQKSVFWEIGSRAAFFWFFLGAGKDFFLEDRARGAIFFCFFGRTLGAICSGNVPGAGSDFSVELGRRKRFFCETSGAEVSFLGNRELRSFFFGFFWASGRMFSWKIPGAGGDFFLFFWAKKVIFFWETGRRERLFSGT